MVISVIHTQIVVPTTTTTIVISRDTKQFEVEYETFDNTTDQGIKFFETSSLDVSEEAADAPPLSLEGSPAMHLWVARLAGGK